MNTVRLNKYIAGSSVCSRRKADEYIKQGLVQVNGKIEMQLGTVINPDIDRVRVNGKEIVPEQELVYILLNKPVGCVTTAKDQFGRPTVMDYVKDIPYRIFPVGRLDYNTSGLLLLTNDGHLTNKITHPKNKVEKTYLAQVSKVPTQRQLEQLRSGLIIDNYKTAPARVEIFRRKEGCELKIIITEGRNRQVRKMCEAISCPVTSLHRISIGFLTLDGLKPGNYRKLSQSELSKLFKYAS